MSVPYRIVEFVNSSHSKVKLMSIWSRRDSFKIVSVRHLILLKMPFSDSELNRAKCEILADVTPNATDKNKVNQVNKKLKLLPEAERSKGYNAMHNIELWNNLAKDSRSKDMVPVGK